MALKRIPDAEKAILVLLEKEESKKDTKDLWNVKDTNTLWNNLQSNKLKRMEDEKGLIRLCLEDKHITRMWEIAACRHSEIAHLMAPSDKNLKAPNDKAAKDSYAAAVGLHADPVVVAMLPQAGQPPVKWIGKRGSEQKEGRDTLYFPWESSSKGFKEEFEMTISNGDKPNEYRVRFGGIGGDNPNEHRIDMQNISLSVERNPDSLLPLPDDVKSLVRDPPKYCVMAFTFGVAPNQIIVYIRFASPTVLVGKAFKAKGKAFKANWKDEDKEKWGDLILAKIN